MSVVGTVRANIVAGLEAITTPVALAGKVRHALTEGDVFALHNVEHGMVYLCWNGLQEIGVSVMGRPRRTEVTLQFSICAVAVSYASPVEAQTKLGGTDDLVEAIRGIRGASISVPDQPGVILRLRSEEVVEHPERVERGGPVMVICRYETTPMTI